MTSYMQKDYNMIPSAGTGQSLAFDTCRGFQLSPHSIKSKNKHNRIMLEICARLGFAAVKFNNLEL